MKYKKRPLIPRPIAYIENFPYRSTVHALLHYLDRTGEPQVVGNTLPKSFYRRFYRLGLDLLPNHVELFTVVVPTAAPKVLLEKLMEQYKLGSKILNINEEGGVSYLHCETPPVVAIAPTPGWQGLTRAQERARAQEFNKLYRFTPTGLEIR